jgi:hypothetical protein
MAWNAHTVAAPGDLEKRLKKLEPVGEESSPERNRQAKAARAAALASVESGAGGDGEAFQVAISGHANPGHGVPEDPTENHDNVTVQITQMPQSVLDDFDSAS